MSKKPGNILQALKINISRGSFNIGMAKIDENVKEKDNKDNISENRS